MKYKFQVPVALAFQDKVENDFGYEIEDDFDDFCNMYSDDIQLEHSSSCICRIPDWAKKK